MVQGQLAKLRGWYNARPESILRGGLVLHLCSASDIDVVLCGRSEQSSLATQVVDTSVKVPRGLGNFQGMPVVQGARESNLH